MSHADLKEASHNSKSLLIQKSPIDMCDKVMKILDR